MNTKHTDSVEAEFKQKFCRPRITPLKDEIPMLHSVTQAQDIIDWITSLQATHSQQIEEAVRKEREGHLNDLIRITERIIRKEVTVEEYLVRWKEMLQALTPNHQD